jgi:hypothetical protein
MLGLPTSLAQVYLAGFAAEHLLTGRRPRSLDVEVGLGLLAHLDPHLVETFDGVEATDGYGAVQQALRSGVREIEDDIRAEVEHFYGVARESLVAVWPSVKALAKALLAHEELDRDALDAAIGEADILGPVSAVQGAHGLLPKAPPVGCRERPGRERRLRQSAPASTSWLSTEPSCSAGGTAAQQRKPIW